MRFVQGFKENRGSTVFLTVCVAPVIFNCIGLAPKQRRAHCGKYSPYISLFSFLVSFEPRILDRTLPGSCMSCFVLGCRLCLCDADVKALSQVMVRDIAVLDELLKRCHRHGNCLFKRNSYGQSPIRLSMVRAFLWNVADYACMLMAILICGKDINFPEIVERFAFFASRFHFRHIVKECNTYMRK